MQQQVNTRPSSRLFVISFLALTLALLAGCSTAGPATPDASETPGTPAAPKAQAAPTPATGTQGTPADQAPVAPTAYPITLTDDEGRQVTLPAEPKRILSLAPSASELVFALGKGDRLVGRTDFGDYPPAVTQVPSVGSLFPPNYEAIVATAPDLVLMMGGSKDVKQKLVEEYKLNVFTLQPTDFSGVYHDLEMLGQALNANGEAVTIIGQMKSVVDEVAPVVAKLSYQPRVFYLVSDEGWWTVGRGTFVDSLISLAGGWNVADVDGYSTFSLEKLVAANPDVLVVEQPGAADRVRANPALASLRAVQEGRVITVPDVNIVVRPGPRLVEGLRWFADALHPGIFK